MKIDHLMYAVPDLEEGTNGIENLTGIRPVYGGPHPGRGTCNALLSLGDSVYLEIIAPDPDHVATEGDLGTELRRLDGPYLRTWAACANNLNEVSRNLASLGLKASPLIDMSRSLPSGKLLQWQLLFASGHNYDNLIPFFIDWKGSPHPALTSPGGANLEKLILTSPDTQGLNSLIKSMGLDVDVRQDDKSGMEAHLKTPAGSVILK